VALVVREESIPIHGVTKGLNDMLAVLTDKGIVLGNPGFIMRGTDPKTARPFAGACVLSERQRRTGDDVMDALREFLRTQVPNFAKMVRESSKKAPWEVVPLNLVPVDPRIASRVKTMAERTPFHQDVNGQDLWFAQSTVALRQGEDGQWRLTYINPVRTKPTMVGPEYAADGLPEPPVAPPVRQAQERATEHALPA